MLLLLGCLSCQEDDVPGKAYFQPTEETSTPWVYWYWMKGAYSKEGITADLKAMKAAGIGGAYLMSIKGPEDPPLIDPPVLQLSKEWWEMVKFAIAEADTVGLEIAMHASDGFAIAGGPWIKPEQSMQKVVWADTIVNGGGKVGLQLPQPPSYKGYYRDIATFALPVKEKERNSFNISPIISSTLTDFDASFLSDTEKDGNFKLYEKGWVQYEFEKPFTCRSVTVQTKGNNYQAHRLEIWVSDNGKNYRSLGRLIAPRQGWQDTDYPYTHAIPPTTAKFFRFGYDPEGSEPGAEDLDAAKWKQSLKVSKIILSNQSIIDNIQGKSGLIWRISPATGDEQIPPTACVGTSEIINISKFLDHEGSLDWNAPGGQWKIMRFGYTSTGQENATGGAGKGLEVDKFNPEAIRFQFDQWFGEAVRTAGPDLAPRVLSMLHIDSWEAGSQNWSPVFRQEFKERRGYDVVDYLPIMAGIPLENVQKSEQILYDVRKTIAELITDNFFGTMAEEAEKVGAKFSAENVAPTMVSDALMHFKNVDYPGGEFWLKSPTHDKPNDILDAISGGHIYGKPIIQAEAFTALRMDWDEHPGNLKTLADRNYALGVNRYFYHVFVHNPWTDRKPGMTLDGIGTYFQRDQTWWGAAGAWVDYCKNVQFQLQKGIPVVDLAVFTGEELPSRAVLPDRLLPFIPNVFGKSKVLAEKKRMENVGQPTANMPREVTYSGNVTGLSDWINPLNGYKYDSFNPDVLLNDAKVEDGTVFFKGDIGYRALLFPDSRKMSPNLMMSLPVAEKILKLTKEGATLLVGDKPTYSPGFEKNPDSAKWHRIIDEIWSGEQNAQKNKSPVSWRLGKGTVVTLPYDEPDFSALGITPDILFPSLPRETVNTFAWNHREAKDEEIYFISNQKEEPREVNVSFRILGRKPYLYDPVLNEMRPLSVWKTNGQRTIIPIRFDENQSLFIIFKGETDENHSNIGNNWNGFRTVKTLDENWQVQFDQAFNGTVSPWVISKLFDWTDSENDSIKYYSGTAVYTKTFNWEDARENIWLNLGEVANIAEVIVNDKSCGVIWTYPYHTNISSALRKGVNQLKIKITNTWANRLIGDQKLPARERLTWTTAPFRLQDEKLLRAGLFGPVEIEKVTLNE